MYAKSTRPSAKRDDRIARPRRAQTCKRSELRAMRMCPRSGQIFFYIMLKFKVKIFIFSKNFGTITITHLFLRICCIVDDIVHIIWMRGCINNYPHPVCRIDHYQFKKKTSLRFNLPESTTALTSNAARVRSQKAPDFQFFWFMLNRCTYVSCKDVLLFYNWWYTLAFI